MGRDGTFERKLIPSRYLDFDTIMGAIGSNEPKFNKKRKNDVRLARVPCHFNTSMKDRNHILHAAHRVAHLESRPIRLYSNSPGQKRRWRTTATLTRMASVA